jgi:hypothetical protein
MDKVMMIQRSELETLQPIKDGVAEDLHPPGVGPLRKVPARPA